MLLESDKVEVMLRMRIGIIFLLNPENFISIKTQTFTHMQMFHAGSAGIREQAVCVCVCFSQLNGLFWPASCTLRALSHVGGGRKVFRPKHSPLRVAPQQRLQTLTGNGETIDKEKPLVQPNTHTHTDVHLTCVSV